MSVPRTPCPAAAPHRPRPPPRRRVPTGARWRKLLPYLWRYRWRVGIALAFLVAAKVANVGVPLLLKQLVDA
jgi:ATP-binding cassette, subfamily B, heavy metal transporter